MTPWHRAYFHITYIDKYIDAWIYTYKHTYCTYKHSKIHSFTLVHTHYILYIFIYLLIAYIYTLLQLSFSSIFDCGSFFSELLFYFLIFPYSLFTDWAKNITYFEYPIEVRLFTVHDNNQFLHYYYYRWSVTSNVLNVMGRYIVNGARG